MLDGAAADVSNRDKGGQTEGQAFCSGDPVTDWWSYVCVCVCVLCVLCVNVCVNVFFCV